MKQMVTFRSLMAAFFLCFSSVVMAQWSAVWVNENMGDAYLGKATALSFTCGGENLTADVDFQLKSNIAGDIISPSTVTITKSKLERNRGKLDFTLTADASSTWMREISVTPVSQGSDDLSELGIVLYISVSQPPYSTISECVASGLTEESKAVVIESEIAVTHVFLEAAGTDTLWHAWVQDESYGAILRTWGGNVAYKLGDHFDGLKVTASQGYRNVYLDYEQWAAPKVSSNALVEPTLISLADAHKHIGRLVHIKNVKVSADQDVRSDVLTAEDKIAITADDTAAQITFFLGSDLLGEPAPTISGTIDLTGIIRSAANGSIVISPRGKADIVAISGGETTDLRNTEMATEVRKVIENGQLYIVRDGVRYNVLGAKE